MSLEVGRKVKIIAGEDAGRIGVIYNIYTTDGIPSVAVQFSENDYGMYKLYHVEAV